MDAGLGPEEDAQDAGRRVLLATVRTERVRCEQTVLYAPVCAGYKEEQVPELAGLAVEHRHVFFLEQLVHRRIDGVDWCGRRRRIHHGDRCQCGAPLVESPRGGLQGLLSSHEDLRHRGPASEDPVVTVFHSRGRSSCPRPPQLNGSAPFNHRHVVPARRKRAGVLYEKICLVRAASRVVVPSRRQEPHAALQIKVDHDEPGQRLLIRSCALHNSRQAAHGRLDHGPTESLLCPLRNTSSQEKEPAVRERVQLSAGPLLYVVP